MKSNNDYTNDTKIALLQQNNDFIHETLTEIKQKLIQTENNSNSRFDKLENRFDKIEGRIWTLHLWNTAQLTGILYLIAHAFHWI